MTHNARTVAYIALALTALLYLALVIASAVQR